ASSPRAWRRPRPPNPPPWSIWPNGYGRVWSGSRRSDVAPPEPPTAWIAVPRAAPLPPRARDPGPVMDVRKEVKPRMERRRRRWREYGLTVGTLGSSAGQSLMVALMPVLLASYAPSAVAIGLAVGSEGLFAMLIPYWIGHLSDRLPVRLADRFGRRTFILALFAPVLAGTLVAVPFVRGYWPLVVVASLFFAALHAYLTPLWTLMVDAVPDRRRGRVHG